MSDVNYISLHDSDAVTASGVVFVKKHVGHLPYEDDKDVSLVCVTTYVYPCYCYA